MDIEHVTLFCHYTYSDRKPLMTKPIEGELVEQEIPNQCTISMF